MSNINESEDWCHYSDLPSPSHYMKKEMENKNQTAVEFLIENLKMTLPKSIFEDVVIQDLFNQSKKRETAQIFDAWDNGSYDGSVLNGEKYYRETYGK